MSFSTFGLDARLQKSVALLGFEQPTPIQSATIPVALTGQDILGSAETGTGKTAAYLIPVIQKMLAQNTPTHSLRVLVLVPTRELALQVAEQAQALVRHTDLRVAAIYGGVGMMNQEQALKRRTDIIIATPGRLQDHMNRGYCRSRIYKCWYWMKPTACWMLAFCLRFGASYGNCRANAKPCCSPQPWSLKFFRSRPK
jgi:superfamily II DNA/RNA helicase